MILTALVLIAVIGCGVAYAINPPAMYGVFIAIVVLAFILGILLTIPIGGADMPVVIALLNSYSGLAACAAGFIISKHRAHRVGIAGGRQRTHPYSHHVQGHEPLTCERTVRGRRRDKD